MRIPVQHQTYLDPNCWAKLLLILGAAPVGRFKQGIPHLVAHSGINVSHAYVYDTCVHMRV